MNRQRVFILLLIGLAALAGCNKAPSAPAPPPAPEATDPRGHLLHAQAKLPTIKVLLGDPSLKPEAMQVMTAEIARQPVEIATGMMFRTNMPENEAMIFVFTNPEPRNFYMRNCTVPLSAAYISPSGEILEIVNLQPHDERGVQSRTRDIQFVLEVPQGWFSRHQVGLNAVVRTERGSLKETFFPKTK
jgi:uncharacterized protein